MIVMDRIKVRNPQTGVQGVIKSYDPEKRIVRLTNKVTVLDRSCEWEYYNEIKNSWFKCFRKK